jgi:hypothetical protein
MNAQGTRGLFAETMTDANWARSLWTKGRHGRAATAWAAAAPPSIMDRFTSALEQDLPIARIARRMNIGEAKADALLARVRRELGWQAR